MTDTLKHVNVRIDSELHGQAVELARKRHQSLNGLIVTLLEHAVATDQKQKRGRADGS